MAKTTFTIDWEHTNVTHTGMGTPAYRSHGQWAYRLAGTNLIVTTRADGGLNPDEPMDEALIAIDDLRNTEADEGGQFDEAERARRRRSDERWDVPLGPKNQF